MGKSGFRLDDAVASNLVWLFTRSAEAVGGLAAQDYRSSGGGTAPDRLLFQESAVDRRASSLQREARLLARRRRLLELPGGEAVWSALQSVYGDRGSPWEPVFGELAPLVEGGGVVRRAALEGWVDAHVAGNRARYGWWSDPAERAKVGGWGANARMLRLLPEAATEEELRSEGRRLLDRLASAASKKRPLSPAEEKLRDDARAEADEVLSAASRAWAKVCLEARLDDARARRRARGEDKAAVEEGSSLLDRVNRLLENWPGAQAAE